VRTERFDGLEHAVDALNAMFTGANTGKIVITLPAWGGPPSRG
jgi:NADPH-dependent curcumin reductase CurA